MIRFILKRRFVDMHIDMGEIETFLTVDADVPQLEALLTSGGHGNAGFDFVGLVGCEVLPAQAGGAKS